MFKQEIYELKGTSTHLPGLRGCQMVGGGKMNNIINTLSETSQFAGFNTTAMEKL